MERQVRREHPRRIGLLIARASRVSGGVFEVVAAQCETIRHLGMQPVVVAPDNEADLADHGRIRSTGAELVAVESSRWGIAGNIARMTTALHAARLDLLHLHGIWLWPSAAAANWAHDTGRPYYISPHGMLDPWILARSRAKKALARVLYERRNWAAASRFHALTRDEAEDIARAAGRHECLIIPNAVTGSPGAATRAPTVAYLGRIHSKKNLGALIEGWKLARGELGPQSARLQIAGWGAPEDVEELERQIAASGGEDIEFLGPLFGSEKQGLLENARFLCLPSHSEGLPMAILEAWASGTPTLMSRHCHLPEGYEAGAALDCGTDPATIAASLLKAFATTDTAWAEMSQAATVLVATRFSPEAVAAKWLDAYATPAEAH